MDVILGLMALFVAWAVLFGPKLKDIRKKGNRR